MDHRKVAATRYQGCLQLPVNTLMVAPVRPLRGAHSRYQRNYGYINEENHAAAQTCGVPT